MQPQEQPPLKKAGLNEMEQESNTEILAMGLPGRNNGNTQDSRPKNGLRTSFSAKRHQLCSTHYWGVELTFEGWTKWDDEKAEI